MTRVYIPICVHEPGGYYERQPDDDRTDPLIVEPGVRAYERNIMKVRTCKTIDIDCEVDVDLTDVLDELHQRAKVATPEFYRQAMQALDWMTRILASVSDETIAAFPERAREVLCQRLQTQATRYDDAP